MPGVRNTKTVPPRLTALSSCGEYMNDVHITVAAMTLAKAMIFLKRRADLSVPAFQDWWLTAHRPLAERLPGLVRHSFNTLPPDAPFDAVVEQWFETKDHMNGCYATDAGRAVAVDSAAHTALRIRVVVDAHDFAVPSVTGL